MVRQHRTLKLETLETRTVLSGTPIEVPTEVVERVPIQAFMNSAQLGDVTVLTASTTEHGRELFAVNADGEFSLLSDLRVGSEGSSIQNWAVIGDHVYFEANDGTGRSGYRTDGTVEGTELLSESRGRGASDFVAIGNTLYYNSGGLKYRPLTGSGATGSVPGELIATVNDRAILRASNGAGTRTINLQTFRPDEGVLPLSDKAFGLTVTVVGTINDQLLFVGATPDDGKELWVTDGSPFLSLIHI